MFPPALPFWRYRCVDISLRRKRLKSSCQVCTQNTSLTYSPNSRQSPISTYRQPHVVLNDLFVCMLMFLHCAHEKRKEWVAWGEVLPAILKTNILHWTLLSRSNKTAPCWTRTLFYMCNSCFTDRLLQPDVNKTPVIATATVFWKRFLTVNTAPWPQQGRPGVSLPGLQMGVADATQSVQSSTEVTARAVLGCECVSVGWGEVGQSI